MCLICVRAEKYILFTHAEKKTAPTPASMKKYGKEKQVKNPSYRLFHENKHIACLCVYFKSKIRLLFSLGKRIRCNFT